jgi:hypothetical protein
MSESPSEGTDGNVPSGILDLQATVSISDGTTTRSLSAKTVVIAEA